MTRTPRILATAVTAALAASLAACGGGGSNALPSANTPQTPVKSTQSATAQMVISIPPASAASVRRNYISPSTKSMTIGLVSGSTTKPLTEVDLTPTSPNCSAVTGGGTKCTVNLVADAGQQTFALKMYDQTGGKGNLLSSADVAANLTASQSTSVPVVLDGVPAKVAVVLGTATLPVGNAGSTSVTVQATDADGNVIVGPGAFTTPVTLAITGDSYKTLALSSTSVTQPGQALTLSYNGGTNIGSTITPSIGSTADANGAATFAGTGAAITQMVPNLTLPSGYNYWLYPADVAALPNGKVGALFESQKYTCSTYCTWTYAWTLGIGSTSGFQNYYAGDTTDPFNPSNATSDFASVSGVTVVKGMSLNEVGWPTNGEQQHTLVSDAAGNLYYSASFSSTAATDGCSGGTLNSGVIGVFNTSAATTKEIVLKGVPQYLQTDSSGNVWFIEKSGTCNGTALLPSGWAIGELKAGSATPVETDLGTVGVASNIRPYAMNITPDGSSMFIADGNNGTIVKVATAAMTSTTVTLNNSVYPYAVAAGPDGTAYWMSGNSGTNDDYYYGYIEGSKPFATENVQEALFPVPYFYGYDAVYADGSFWGAGYDNYGLGRTSGLSSGSPQIQFYSTQTPYYAEPYSLSAGSGYIWAADDDYDSVLAIQYGQQSTATTTLAGARKTMESASTSTTTTKINSWHRIGTFSSVPLPLPDARKRSLARLKKG